MGVSLNAPLKGNTYCQGSHVIFFCCHPRGSCCLSVATYPIFGDHLCLPLADHVPLPDNLATTPVTRRIPRAMYAPKVASHLVLEDELFRASLFEARHGGQEGIPMGTVLMCSEVVLRCKSLSASGASGAALRSEISHLQSFERYRWKGRG